MEKVKPSVPVPSQVQDKELKKLKKASDDFEQIFVSMMLKEMHKGLGKTGFLDKGPYEKMFRDLLLDERAKAMSQGAGFGLSNQLYNQLSASIKGKFASTSKDSDTVQELYHQNTIERIANDYRRTKGNQGQ
jgi:peptidoglycan hydrolase FlgJ